ncbi:MAG TPA: hypothetical protein VK826_16460 [Bacteroidia bacterium]|nr:hypothetical protein [Bacteroidia bacterium]
MKTSSIIFLASFLFACACEIMPRNTLKDCQEQCKDREKSKACYEFCDCIHQHGESLDSCLDAYNKAPADSVQPK